MNAKSTKALIDSKTESNAVAALKQLPTRPPESKKSARAVINGMSELIRARIASGYTYEQIAEVLSGAGVHVAAATLRAYLTASKADGSKRKVAKKVQQIESEQSNMFATPEATQVQRPAVQPRPPAFQDPDEK
jgi:cyanate lyase